MMDGAGRVEASRGLMGRGVFFRADPARDDFVTCDDYRALRGGPCGAMLWGMNISFKW